MPTRRVSRRRFLLIASGALVRPVAEGLFAGAILFKNYRFLDSLGMRIFAAAIKVNEGDYRDWPAIDAWADSTRPLLLR